MSREEDWDFRESPEDATDTYDPAGVGRWSNASARKLKVQERNEMADKREGGEVVRLHTPIFRCSFPQVFKPRAVVAGQDEKYSISMLWPKAFTAEYCAQFKTTPEAQIKLMEAMKLAVTAAAVAKWGADKAKWPKGLTSPWHKGEEKDYDGYGPDVIFSTASSKIKPGLVDAKMQPIIEPGDFYGGCYAHATVTVFAYDNVKKGVSFGLRNIQKLRDGEAFGGNVKVEDDFGAIAAPASEAKDAVPAGATASEDLGI